MSKYSSEEIINAFRNSNSKILEDLYVYCFPSIRKLILLNKGRLNDAEDIFADAMTLCFLKIRDNPDFTLNCAFETYIYSICRHMWIDKLKYQKNYKEVFYDTNALCNMLIDDFDIEEFIRDNKRHFLYLKHFAGISSLCQKVIQMFLNKMSLALIAKETGVTENFAKKRNYECKKSLIKKIYADSEYNDTKIT
jgi:RNA polymerase sigma factor (sigma-70 family)